MIQTRVIKKYPLLLKRATNYFGGKNVPLLYKQQAFDFE